MPVIMELKEVSKSYGYNSVLDGISIKVDEGTITGVIGKSGCGKSTLLSLMVGFLKPTKGKVYYKGKDLFKTGKKNNGDFGFSSQATSFYDRLTVEENINYFGRMCGIPKKVVKERADELIKMFELESASDTMGMELSSGMQKRLDIACALINDPEILFLDEPTANLDPLLRKEIINLIKKIKEAGVTVVITSHILGEIDYLCDKIAILDNKQLVAVDSPKNLVKNFLKEKSIKVLLESRDYKKLEVLGKMKGVRNMHPEDDALIIISSQPEEVIRKIIEIAEKTKDDIDGIKMESVSIGVLFESIMKKRNNRYGL